MEKKHEIEWHSSTRFEIEWHYYSQHHSITESAIGSARFYLIHDDPKKAYIALTQACDEIDRVHAIFLKELAELK